MSIRILLDHGVKEDRIIFVTFLVAQGGGVSVLRRAFPKMKIVCGAVDDEMREGWLEGYEALGNPEGHGRKVWLMQPGMGQIGLSFSLRVARSPRNNAHHWQGIVIIYNWITGSGPSDFCCNHMLATVIRTLMLSLHEFPNCSAA